jgi:hypothetical protein
MLKPPKQKYSYEMSSLQKGVAAIKVRLLYENLALSNCDGLPNLVAFLILTPYNIMAIGYMDVEFGPF